MIEVFHQVYDPVGGSVLLSALVAALPPILLAILLAVLRIAPWRAAIAAAATRLPAGVAGLGHAASPDRGGGDPGDGVRPVADQLDRPERGVLLQPVGRERRLRRHPPVAGARDRRPAHSGVLVAFCFGALIEGIAGFGAPVAITASMLAGLGFAPIMAATLALIANTTPVAFGSLGIPITTLGGLLAPMLGHDTQIDDAGRSRRWPGVSCRCSRSSFRPISSWCWPAGGG